MPKGSCLCGSVTYNLDIDPSTTLPTSVCHCRPCRKITGGTTSLNLTVPATAFTLNSGTLKKVKSKHMDEGFDFQLSFCEDCGSPIFGEAPFLPDQRIIQAGTLDDEEYLQQAPATELNVKHRPLWIKSVDAAGQKETYV